MNFMGFQLIPSNKYIKLCDWLWQLSSFDMMSFNGKHFPSKIIPMERSCILTFMTCLSSPFFQRCGKYDTTTSPFYNTQLRDTPVYDIQTQPSSIRTSWLYNSDAQMFSHSFRERTTQNNGKLSRTDWKSLIWKR